MATAAMGESQERSAFTAPEAARYIGMSLSYVEHSDIPRVRLGRAVRYLRADLDSYLAQRRDRAIA